MTVRTARLDSPVLQRAQPDIRGLVRICLVPRSADASLLPRKCFACYPPVTRWFLFDD
jgi:hypothetical protein